MLLLQIYIKFNMDSREYLESMWSPCGVQHRESSGITGTPHGFHMDSTRTPGTFWLCPRHLKIYLEFWWSPSGVPLEYRESSGVHTERVGQCKDLLTWATFTIGTQWSALGVGCRAQRREEKAEVSHQ